MHGVPSDRVQKILIMSARILYMIMPDRSNHAGLQWICAQIFAQRPCI